jgi:hypothetical protein
LQLVNSLSATVFVVNGSICCLLIFSVGANRFHLFTEPTFVTSYVIQIQGSNWLYRKSQNHNSSEVRLTHYPLSLSRFDLSLAVALLELSFSLYLPCPKVKNGWQSNAALVADDGVTFSSISATTLHQPGCGQ